uniref:Wall-associated receptor kinase C-terminal domain-containing protein n=1 Tax=Brassica oleracea var. oleracea TaxID=109376 RepID=A0A0D3CYI8_BRAOL
MKHITDDFTADNSTCRMRFTHDCITWSPYGIHARRDSRPEYGESYCNKSFIVNVPKSFVVPEQVEISLFDLESIIFRGFEVKVKIDEIICQECSSSGGICSFNGTAQVCCKTNSSPSGVICEPKRQRSEDDNTFNLFFPLLFVSQLMRFTDSAVLHFSVAIRAVSGLVKLCERKESMLSLLDTRGTIGYIAPQVFSRVYGRVSHKSDVYSYGMLVLEMIGARTKISTDDTRWMILHLAQAQCTFLNGYIGILRRETMEGFLKTAWPSNRPPMNRVIEMMDGNLNTLEFPPTPAGLS